MTSERAVCGVQRVWERTDANTGTWCNLTALCVWYFQREDHRYPKLDFTQEDLIERFKRQLDVEQACTITIDSVEAAKPVTENMAKMVNRPNCLHVILHTSSARMMKLQINNRLFNIWLLVFRLSLKIYKHINSLSFSFFFFWNILLHVQHILLLNIGMLLSD